VQHIWISLNCHTHSPLRNNIVLFIIVLNVRQIVQMLIISKMRKQDLPTVLSIVVKP